MGSTVFLVLSYITQNASNQTPLKPSRPNLQGYKINCINLTCPESKDLEGAHDVKVEYNECAIVQPSWCMKVYRLMQLKKLIP